MRVRALKCRFRSLKCQDSKEKREDKKKNIKMATICSPSCASNHTKLCAWIEGVRATPDPNNCARHQNTSGSCIVIRLGGVHTSSSQEEGILLQSIARAIGVANQPAPYRGLSGPKSLENVSRGLQPRNPEKVSKKSREQSGKSPESLRKVSTESFRTVPETFWRLFGVSGPEAPGGIFETLEASRARRARETSIRGGLVRKIGDALRYFSHASRPGVDVIFLIALSPENSCEINSEKRQNRSCISNSPEFDSCKCIVKVIPSNKGHVQLHKENDCLRAGNCNCISESPTREPPPSPFWQLTRTMV